MMRKASLRLAGVLVLALAVTGIATASAAAATISGSLKNGKGYQVLLVQSNGTTKKARISSAAGTFSIGGASLGNASLQLVRRDGSYYGPVVLKAAADKAYVFVARSAGLNLGAIVLKGGYALVKVAPVGRYQKLATASAKAVRGKPIGAGRLGLVRTAEPGGLNGPGADLDRDGVINAFDIDDNGNLILDNVDRTGRGAARRSVVKTPGGRPTSLSLLRAAVAAAGQRVPHVLELQVVRDDVDQREHPGHQQRRRAHRPVRAVDGHPGHAGDGRLECDARRTRQQLSSAALARRHHLSTHELRCGDVHRRSLGLERGRFRRCALRRADQAGRPAVGDRRGGQLRRDGGGRHELPRHAELRLRHGAGACIVPVRHRPEPHGGQLQRRRHVCPGDEPHDTTRGADRRDLRHSDPLAASTTGDRR